MEEVDGEGKNVIKIYKKLKIVLNNKNEYKNTKKTGVHKFQRKRKILRTILEINDIQQRNKGTIKTESF